MKIVLLQPPVQDFYDTDIRLQPLGLCYLKAALMKYCPDDQVVVRDFHHGWGRRTVAVPKELRYLKSFYSQVNQSPFSSFCHYYHFGADYQTIASEVARLTPDLIGISALFSPYYREVLACAAAIKTRVNVPIVVGGGQASCCPELMLGDPHVDFIVIGQGEKPLVELVSSLGRGNSGYAQIAGLGWKVAGQLWINPPGPAFDFAKLPMPDLSDLPVDRYLYQGKPIAFVQTSRGCPHRCGFCSVHQIFGRGFQRRNTGQIIEEMEFRIAQGYRVFDFEDDNLTFDQQEFIGLCEQINQRFDVSQLTLLAMNGISYQNLDANVLAHMKRAGFSRLNLALVSADQKLLRSVGRPHRVDGLAGVVETAFALGLGIEVHMIIGLPGDTLEAMGHTLTMLAVLPALIGVSTFYLTPGTDATKHFPIQTEEDIFKARSTAMAITSDVCTRRDLFTLFTIARIINFLKGLELDISQEKPLLLADLQALSNVREEIGMEILTRLLAEGRLYGHANGNFFEVQNFNVELFQTVWEALDMIRTQKGKWLALR